MVTNLVIRLFDSQTRAAAEDTLIKVRENSYTKRIKAIPPTVSLLIMDSWLQSQVESVLDFISLEEFTCSLETTAKETKFFFFFRFRKVKGSFLDGQLRDDLGLKREPRRTHKRLRV